ncbi:hypothetical protein IscW_ISCW019338 [Ixodes scapularis]|uniref:Uncharacterized protein n=1 Tax=Ixodes scapularis TaxID=6945 RepID=B7PTL5_IXOSC|nr:hypothetical protein IscW_ISCW019338 [Ixodes scapularis]|eukprot:XP_002404640.1 hypothetical protein IscW_ISCW019338 [Ixodes scapularis]
MRQKANPTNTTTKLLHFKSDRQRELRSRRGARVSDEGSGPVNNFLGEKFRPSYLRVQSPARDWGSCEKLTRSRAECLLIDPRLRFAASPRLAFPCP